MKKMQKGSFGIQHFERPPHKMGVNLTQDEAEAIPNICLQHLRRKVTDSTVSQIVRFESS
jgi:hypothetical protein